jgi:Uma2 family endonuclease
MSTTLPGVRRLSLDEYEAMVRDGRLDPIVAVELLDGIMVPKMTKGLRHVDATRGIQEMLREALPPGWTVLKEDPIALPIEGPDGGGTLPEPDVTVVRGSRKDYGKRYPGPADLMLVVEVASNAKMLKGDREGLARYARNGVPRIWLVNLLANVVEVYTEPTGPGDDPVYEANTVARPGDTLIVDLGPCEDGGRNEIRLAVSELLA